MSAAVRSLEAEMSLEAARNLEVLTLREAKKKTQARKRPPLGLMSAAVDLQKLL
jgi:hypothetical protein